MSRRGWTCGVLTLLLMLIAGGLGLYYGRRPADFQSYSPDELARRSVPKEAAKKDDGLVAPRLLNLGELQADIRRYYPQAEHRAGKQGRVTVSMVVGTDGAVSRIGVAVSGGADFDEAAKKAARAMRFSPARRSGVPVAVEISEVVDFQFDSR